MIAAFVLLDAWFQARLDRPPPPAPSPGPIVVEGRTNGCSESVALRPLAFPFEFPGE